MNQEDVVYLTDRWLRESRVYNDSSECVQRDATAVIVCKAVSATYSRCRDDLLFRFGNLSLEPLSKFVTGQVVQKTTGDYKFVGNVTVIRKRSGEYRYAVENDDGMIHIFNGSQLELVP